MVKPLFPKNSKDLYNARIPMKIHSACFRQWMALTVCVLLFLANTASFAEGSLSSSVRYTADFEYVKAISPNGVAWLYQPDTTINQPVFFSADKTYYLKRRYDGMLNNEGSVFVLSDSEPDFSAPVVTIRGNNCMDGSMFGSLSLYREEEYYQKHPSLYLFTPESDYQLDVFAGIRISSDELDDWLVTADDIQNPETLQRILEASFLNANPDLLPAAGDCWAVLMTDSTQKRGVRYLIYARKRAIVQTGTTAVDVNQIAFDIRETLNGYVTAPGVGTWMSYGQNDPSWRKLVFESKTSSQRRTFGDGGCGPTAVAMVLANLVDHQELSKLSQYSAQPLGFRFCDCALNDYHCDEAHLSYQLSTPEEFLRYLPLAIANYATGNNIFGLQGRNDRFGSGMVYLESLCDIFGLSVKHTTKIEEGLAFLTSGDHMVIACAIGSGGNPFTRSSHFLLLVAKDDTHVYILDPLRRDNYDKLDRYKALEIITPGLVRMSLENAERFLLEPIYLIKPADSASSQQEASR